MTPQQRQNLVAILNAVHNAITVISKHAPTTDDPQRLAICHQAMSGLLSLADTAREALQAANDQRFQQEIGVLKNRVNQLQAQEAQVNALLQAGGIALQVVSFFVQIAALVAAL